MVRLCACLIFVVLFVLDVFSDGLFTQKIGNSYHTTGKVNGRKVDVWEQPFLNGTQKHGTIGGQSVNTFSQPFLNGTHEHGTIGGQSVNVHSQPFLNGTQSHGTIGGQSVNMLSQPFLNGTQSHGTIGGQSVNVHSQPFGDGFQTHGTWGNQHDSSFRQQPVVPSLPQKTFGVQHDNAYRFPAAGNLDAPSGGGWCRGTDVDYNPSPTYFDTGSAALDSSSLPHYDYERPRSRPVIEGYERFGADRQSGHLSFGDACEAAAIQLLLHYGVQAVANLLREEDRGGMPVKHSSGRKSSSESSSDSEIPVLPIIIVLLELGAALFLLYILIMIPIMLINRFFGRKCDIVRDQQGRLVSVKMPKPVIIPLVILYIICGLPVVITTLLIVDGLFRGFGGGDQVAAIVGLSVFSSLIMLVPVSFHRGKDIARVFVTLFSFTIIAIAVCAVLDAEVENGWLGWTIVVVLIMVVWLFLSMLYSAQSDEWFRAKKELVRMSSGNKTKALIRMIGRMIGRIGWLFRRAYALVEKWYVLYILIAAILVAICFFVIFRALFTPQ